MINEFINRQAAIEAVKNDALELVYYNKKEAIECIAAVPAVDVVPVVRCKDCVNRHTPNCAMWAECADCDSQWSWEDDNDFCSYGERRE